MLLGSYSMLILTKLHYDWGWNFRFFNNRIFLENSQFCMELVTTETASRYDRILASNPLPPYSNSITRFSSSIRHIG